MKNLFVTNPVKVGDSVHLKAAQNYLSVEHDGQVVHNRTNAFEYETFRIEGYYGCKGSLHYGDYIYLRSAHGPFISVEDGLVITNPDTMPMELVRILYPTDQNSREPLSYNEKIVLQTTNKKYLSFPLLISEGSHVVESDLENACEFQIIKSSYPIVQYNKLNEILPLRLVFIGNVIKLKHINTGNVLHSHDLRYVDSQEQQVTCATGRDDNDWWIIESVDDSDGPLAPTTRIYLKHEKTGLYLFSSEAFQSPKTKQQQVSCGNKDVWVVQRFKEKDGPIEAGEELFFVHEGTGFALHSHNETFRVTNDVFNRQQEVTAFGGADSNDKWKIIEIRGTLYME
jgi:hypothetical protein